MSGPHYIRDLPFAEIHPLIRKYTLVDVQRVFTLDQHMPPINELYRRLVQLQHIVVSVIANKGIRAAEEKVDKEIADERAKQLAGEDLAWTNAMKYATDWNQMPQTERAKAHKDTNDDGDDYTKYSKTKLNRMRSEASQMIVFMLINTLLQICKRAPPVPFAMAVALVQALSVEFDHPDRSAWSQVVHDVFFTAGRSWSTMGVPSKAAVAKFIITSMQPNDAKRIIGPRVYDALNNTKSLIAGIKALMAMQQTSSSRNGDVSTTVLHENESNGCYTYGNQQDKSLREDFVMQEKVFFPGDKEKEYVVATLILDKARVVFDLSGPANKKIEQRTDELEVLMSTMPLPPYGDRTQQFPAPHRPGLDPLDLPRPFGNELVRQRDDALGLSTTFPDDPSIDRQQKDTQIRRLLSRVEGEGNPAGYQTILQAMFDSSEGNAEQGS
ncbi:hypothetical protein C1H76_3335 [Elsinoe australis]|uniref:Uncharacterized protein n=1 Tax=Elsinoe australis TaxID=40998 RepID=A0A4U7B0Z7_9PEZI|nr:hypothetical protein C1H76_3335 [Elsinoe australis]